MLPPGMPTAPELARTLGAFVSLCEPIQAAGAARGWKEVQERVPTCPIMGGRTHACKAGRLAPFSLALSGEFQMKDVEPKLNWVKPEAKRLKAGSAQEGSTESTDLGVSFS